MIKTNKKAILFYWIILLIFIIISLICGIIFSSYEALIVLSLTSFFSFFTLLINFNLGLKKENASTTSFLMISLLRVLSIFVGLIISAVILYFYKSPLTENNEKFKFLYLLLGIVPIFTSNLLFFLRSEHE